MTTVTPIRPDLPEQPPIDPRLAQAIAAARGKVLDVQCIVSVMAASFPGDVGEGEPEHRRVLELIYGQLEAIAAQLDAAEFGSTAAD